MENPNVRTKMTKHNDKNSELIGLKGFHAREKQKVLVRAIVEGHLFLSARSSFFLSSFFLLLSPRIVPKNKDFFARECVELQG